MERSGLRRHWWVLGAAGLLIILLVGSSRTATAATSMPPAQAEATVRARPMEATSVRDDRDYVYSVGTIASVSGQTVTLRFDDGQTETYTLDVATTIQTQNGDAQRLTDLKAGNLALVLSVENSTTAVSIVNGGDAGFHEAGPADMRGHEGPCGLCGPGKPSS